MHLYIFSSKLKSVIRYIIIMVVIVIAYMLGIRSLPQLTATGGGANQWQENIIKAQKYCFEEKDYATVVVGSSEAAKLPVETVSEEYYNLAFSGESCLTGLAIIEASGKKPKQILIELNDTVLRRVDDDIMAQISLWHKLPINQEKYRIDYNLHSLYKPIYEKLMERYHSIDTEDVEPNEELVEMKEISQQELLDEKLLREQIEKVEEYIESFSERGIEIILLELPNDSELYNTPSNVQVLGILEEYFPEDKYTWFRVDWSEYSTTDGIHLNKVSARKYVDEMVKNVL